jgi:hypothetical protein
MWDFERMPSRLLGMEAEALPTTKDTPQQIAE